MSEQPHSAHKPPYNTPSSFGVHYPVNDIVSVIDDRASAEQAVAELRAAGIPAGWESGTAARTGACLCKTRDAHSR